MWEWWIENGYAWVGLPLIIFLARILDVSIATMRFMFLARGMKVHTALLGFIEAMTWIIIIGQVIRNLDNVMCYVAYAGGFAVGSYVGMIIEERLAVGKVILRVIVSEPAAELIAALREKGLGVTDVKAEGAKGDVRVLFMVAKRSNLKDMIAVLNAYKPTAFYTVEDVRLVREGVFPAALVSGLPGRSYLDRWRSRFR
jgi:uncharacterized protein YebE (UPF0316 family)